MKDEFVIYRGDGSSCVKDLPRLDEAHPYSQERGVYKADPDLVDAVNLALWVGQPLLVTGEPGCGKTQLAYSVAKELELGPVEEFFTKSTSRASDLLYTYDAVRQFRDIQLSAARDVGEYIDYGALGRAILAKKRSVVLIDEIDKAPRDFPNDLLTELDRMFFDVKELPEEKRRKSSTERPLVIITSNSERQLPLPFLRRCVFFHIKFPKEAQLRTIISERLGNLPIPAELINAAVDRFTDVRKLKLVKLPATSELLNWVVALWRAGIPLSDLDKGKLAKLPLWQIIIKDRGDHDRLTEASG